MTDAIRVRIAGVTAEVSLQGDDAALAGALRREYLSFAVSVPATADVIAEVTPESDSGVDDVMAAVRRDVLAGVADVHERRGYVQFGAHALIDQRGSALIVIAVDGTDVHDVLTGLGLDIELLAPGGWASDLSGAIVRLPNPTARMDALGSSGLETARPGRVTGALVFGDQDSARAGQDDFFDGLVALARHVIEHGTLNERTPLLRAVRTIAESSPGIRSVSASDIPHLRNLISGWLADAERAPWSSPAFPVRSDAADDSEGVWFRGPAHDYLDRIDDVVVVRRHRTGLAVDVLTPEASVLWRQASGLRREELVDAAMAQARAEGSDRRAMEIAFDDLCRSGALAPEPSWAVGPDVAWSSTPTQVVALSAAASPPYPVSLEGSARAIWEEIVETPYLSLSELVARCAERFEVEADSIRSEVARLLQDLRHRELIGWV